MTSQNIFLVGLMAVGKSTVGRLLAESMHKEFYDTDHVIEERAGADVAWIFDVEGESGFRDREQEVVDELTRSNGIVLATGGGVVLRLCNRNVLAARGVVIHLDSPLERLVERTLRDKKRPLLRKGGQQGEPRNTLRRLQEERAPLYAEISDYRFITDRQGPRVLAQAIEERLREDGIA
ncbi:MAG: shikimate kinase AroK [Gammaproteobacteria bacterium]|nr:shikimate kinase AroK [Gammaproteobacteria bacterium]